MLTSWLAATALALAMVAAAVFPTYFWLRIAKVPSYLAGVFAPATTLTVVIGLGYLYAAAGIFWSGARVLPVLGVIGLAGAAAFLVSRRNEVKGHAEVTRGSEVTLGNEEPPVTTRWGPAFWLAVAAGWVIAVLPVMLAAPAINPVQQWDPAFHMNGLWSINHLGVGRFDEALSGNFIAGGGAGYPSGWHIFVALFSVPATVVPTANASTLALTLLWVVGAAVYTRSLFPVRLVWLIAPVLAGGMLSMPADALAAYSQWPNASAVAFLPGLAAFMIVLGRKVVLRWDNNNAGPSLLGIFGWVAILLFSLAGAIIVHPSVAFNLLVLLLPGVLAGVYTMWRGDLRKKKWWTIALLPVLVTAGFYLLLKVFETDSIRNMGDYPRPGVSVRLGLQNFLTPSPPYADSVSLFMWVAVTTALLLAGVVAIIVNRRSTLQFTEKDNPKLPAWPIWSFLGFASLVFLAYGPDSAFREFIIAPWYLDARRIMEPQDLSVVPLAALGFVWLGRRLQAWLSGKEKVVSPRKIAAIMVTLLLVVSLGEGFSARLRAAQSVMDPTRLGKPGMATAGELEMIRTLPEVLPEDAKVLGDPKNGSVYVQMIGQRRVYFPILTLSSRPDQNERTFVKSFNKIHSDPAVCEAVSAAGVTHFYAEEDGYYYSRLRSDRAPGLYNVDTSSGFELVAEGDTARLYRITACDP